MATKNEHQPRDSKGRYRSYNRPKLEFSRDDMLKAFIAGNKTNNGVFYKALTIRFDEWMKKYD